MQPKDMAEKKRMLIDGEELPGLVYLGPIPLENGELEVPEYDKTRRIQNGITAIPAVEARFKVARDTNTEAFLRDWWETKSQKDVTVIRTDATGREFRRTLLPATECRKYEEPEYDAASPVYAQVAITLLPWDVIPIESE